MMKSGSKDGGNSISLLSLKFLKNGVFMFDGPAGKEDALFYSGENLPSFLNCNMSTGEWALPGTYRRLGRYAEGLMENLLQRCPATELLAAGLQVREGKRTVGEFDFIFREADSGQVIHLEMAIKFYLGIGGGGDMHNWVGPNVKDRLDLKFGKLVEKQSQLSESAAGQLALEEMGWEYVIPRIFLKGALFPKWESGGMEFPARYRPHDLQGYWIGLRDWAKLQEKEACDWALVPRLEWMAVFSGEWPGAFRDFTEVREEVWRLFAAGREPQMVVGSRPGNWVWWGFVVPDWWEAAALESAGLK